MSITDPGTPLTSDATHAGTGLHRLYDDHRLDLRRFLVARTGSAADADDILQEMWIRLNATLSGPVANGRAYLFRMAQNLVLDRLKKERRRGARDGHWLTVERGASTVAPEPVDPAPDAERLLIEREVAERLATAIAALPAGAARAFRLHKLEGLSHGDVAARLGISKSGVEKHMAVAMAHLRRALADD